MYDAASTSQANGHMEDVHRINRDGPMSPQRKKQRTLFDMADLDCRRPKDQAVMNAFIASFDPVRFQHLLVRWVACDNVPFNKLESPYFRELMGYHPRPPFRQPHPFATQRKKSTTKVHQLHLHETRSN
jgi:hypothetical protein